MNLTLKSLNYSLWCTVKHLLCVEEHIVEALERLARIIEKEHKKGDLEKAIELLIILNKVRTLRQNIVEMVLNYESRGNGKEGSKETK